MTETSVKSSTSTSSEGIKFVDEKLDVVPGIVPIAPPPSPPGAEGAPPQPVLLPAVLDYTELDLMVLSETVWTLPNIVTLDAVPVPSPRRLEMFNKQFYAYCRKKGINPWEWFFDEFGLLVAAGACAGEMYRGYREKKAKEEKEEPKPPAKGAEEYEHEKELAALKEKQIKEGVIKNNVPEGEGPVRRDGSGDVPGGVLDEGHQA